VEDDPQVAWYSPSVTPSDMSGAPTGASWRSLVENPYYRENNLDENNIYMRDFDEEFPKEIAKLVNNIRKARGSPGLSSDQLRQDRHLYVLEVGTTEPAVENYFKANIFPDPGHSDSLKRTNRYPMAEQVVPNTGSGLRVSTPRPDMLYGCNRVRAFPQQRAQLHSMGNEMVANS
jgi:hypothetical protein